MDDVGLVPLGAFTHRRRCQQVACLLSGFLVLFALVIGNRPVVLILTGLYGVVMLRWLMARYWERVHRAQALAWVTGHLPLLGSVLVLGIGLAGLLLARGDRGQRMEACFKLMGLVHYTGTNAAWHNDRGEAGSIERMIAEELQQPVIGSACGGTHRMECFGESLTLVGPGL